MDDLIRVDLELVGIDDLSALAVGDTFELQVIGRDLRPEGERQPAVVSLYTDITFDPTVVSAESITYGSAYSAFQLGTINNTNGEVDELGGFAFAFAGGSIPDDTSPVVATITFQLLQTGASPQIKSNVADSPISQTVAVGNDEDLRNRTTFTELNEAPTADNDTFTTDEDAALTTENVLGNDTDPNTADPLTVSLDSDVTSGTLDLQADGSFTYTPNANFNGTDSFSYTVTDAGGLSSESATVTLNVTPVNDAPVAVGETVSTNEGTDITINVLANDSDTEDDSSALTPTIFSQAANGTVGINDNGTITYVPDDGFSGPTDSFQYTVSDSDQESSNPATVTINVNNVNDAPVATDESFTIDEDATATGDVLINDTDADTGDTLSAVLATDPANGSVALNPDGSFVYTPNANFNGSDSFTYTVSDGTLSDTGTVNITVDAINDVPVAVGETVSTNEATAIDIDVLANATDVDGDTLTPTVVNAINGTAEVNTDGTITFTPTPGFSGQSSFTYTVNDGTADSAPAIVTVNVSDVNDAPVATDESFTIDEDATATGDVLTNDTDADAGDMLTAEVASTPANGSVALNPDGSFVYTPNANFNGSDSFTYTVSDGELSDTGTVSITVDPVNDVPVAVGETASTNEGVAVDIDVLANDTDADGDSLSPTVATSPSNGMAVVNADGTIAYTPNLSFSGSDSFTYTVSDGTAASATATVTINVSDVNEAPMATGESLTILEDETATGDVLTNDTDANNDSLVASVLNDPENGEVVLNPDGSFVYTPEANFNGTDSFTYTVSDGELSDTATVNLTITPVNDAPTAVDDSVFTDESDTTTINVANNDSDVDNDSLSVSEVGTAPNGTVVNNNDGTIDYTSNDGFEGTDTFSYTLSDGALTSTATVSVQVQQPDPNRPPVAADDDFTTDENGVLSGNLRSNNGNGRDRDPDNDTLRVFLINGSSFSVGREIPLGNGKLTVKANGRFTFDPNGGYDDLNQGETATESFEYTLSDGNGGRDTATVTIDITGAGTDVVVPVINGQPATAFVDDEGKLVGNAFGAGEPYNGSLFTNTDAGLNPGADISANDVVKGTPGNDNIWTGTQGNDVVDSGAGNDTVGFGGGNSQVSAGSGNDFVYAIGTGSGNNTIDLGPGNDNFYAAAGNNNIIGSGNNTISVGTGNDTVTTFEGDDFVYSLGGGGGTNVLNLGGGDNTIWLEKGNYTIATGAGDDIIGLGDGTDVVNAGNGNNIIYMVNPDGAADGPKDILTGSGDDYIQTGSGDDLIDGGTGVNSLVGGLGADTFIFRRGAYNELLDFEIGTDKIDLEGIAFADLTFFEEMGDVFIFTDSSTQGLGVVTDATLSEVASINNFV